MKTIGEVGRWAVFVVLVLAGLAYAFNPGERPDIEPAEIELPPDTVPLDSLAYDRRARPDSADFAQVPPAELSVFCAWSYRDGRRYRWPTDAPGLTLRSEIPLRDVVHLPGRQLCVRLIEPREPIT